MGPQLRASDEHCFIVRVLRARRTLCLPPLRSCISFSLPRTILFPWSLSDIAPSTTANDDQASTLFLVQKNPQRIPANTPPAFRNLRPRICLPLLRLVTNGNIGKAPANPLAF
jgi:hypothetical protein